MELTEMYKSLTDGPTDGQNDFKDCGHKWEEEKEKEGPMKVTQDDETNNDRVKIE